MLKDHVYLYVEDDAMSRDALSLVFRRIMGIETLTVFENSTDFMGRVRTMANRPDIFLLDIHMKPHTGFEMLAMLRASEAFRDSIVIALTASVMNEEVQMLKTAGFDGVIGKPIDVEILPELIARIVEGETVWHITS
ncbi:MAG: response regulator [Chloroflexi bacterium]|nr:response regulator [Chloroflexota bacterium]